MEIEKNPPVKVHIENRRLLNVVWGQSKFHEWEHDHLHACEVCRGVFYVLVNQQATTGKDDKTAGEAA
jgi:hypothetical protein